MVFPGLWGDAFSEAGGSARLPIGEIKIPVCAEIYASPAWVRTEAQTQPKTHSATEDDLYMRVHPTAVALWFEVNALHNLRDSGTQPETQCVPFFARRLVKTLDQVQCVRQRLRMPLG